MVGYRQVMLRPEPPSYDGHGLVNLVAEFEHRLRGTGPTPRLDPSLRDAIPSGRTTVLVLFDGLGSQQLGHNRATSLSSSHVGDLDAPFPSTTTVSLATIATGLPPSQHGLIAYKMWMPDVGDVVNTIHMTMRSGGQAPLNVSELLPSPNLWERLVTAGVESIVVQPGNFADTPLTRALYRGARFEGYWDLDEAVKATIDLSATANRFVFLYIPHVDFAAHMKGQQSGEYAEAMAGADTVWMQLSQRLAPTVTLVGTADHGHVDIEHDARAKLDQEVLGSGFLSEDGRLLFVHGDGSPLASQHRGLSVPAAAAPWWGPGPNHPALASRLPDDIVFLPTGTAVFDPRSNAGLAGYHGSLDAAERLVPLLARG